MDSSVHLIQGLGDKRDPLSCVTEVKYLEIQNELKLRNGHQKS